MKKQEASVMIARIGELYEKEVICIKDGSRLGNVGDVEINTCTGSAESIIVLGKRRFFGLIGREDDLIIPWCCVEVFGDELVLVNYDPPHNRQPRKSGVLSKLFDL